jgi:hypothetical protein
MSGADLARFCDDLGHVWRWRIGPISFYEDTYLGCLHCWLFVRITP